jgi:hypothetical protein
MLGMKFLQVWGHVSMLCFKLCVPWQYTCCCGGTKTLHTDTQTHRRTDNRHANIVLTQNCARLSWAIKVVDEYNVDKLFKYILAMAIYNNDVISPALFICIVIVSVLYINVLIYDIMGIKLQIMRSKVWNTYVNYILAKHIFINDVISTVYLPA